MKEELIVHNESKSPISETFRTLRTNLQFINKKNLTGHRNQRLQSDVQEPYCINNRNDLQTILVTSTMPQEGKSFVSANLAVAFVQVGKKVLLIDADMRKGRQYGIFGVSPKPGLSNYLFDISQKEAKLEEYIQKTEIVGLSLMVAGSIPPNPSELLVSENMINAISELKEKFDIIILDGPPIELVTDSIILTRIVDSTIIVAACNETKKDNLNKVISNIRNVGGEIAGIVVNKVSVPAKEYKNNYYYGNEKKK